MTDFSSTGFQAADDLAKDPPRLRRELLHKLKRLAVKLPFAEDLLAAYYCAFDQQTPRHVQVALLGALAYFVLPFDFVPDMLPLIGFGDDAAVLVTALRMVSSHIRPEHREAAKARMAKGLDDEDEILAS